MDWLKINLFQEPLPIACTTQFAGVIKGLVYDVLRMKDLPSVCTATAKPSHITSTCATHNTTTTSSLTHKQKLTEKWMMTENVEFEQNLDIKDDKKQYENR